MRHRSNKQKGAAAAAIGSLALVAASGIGAAWALYLASTDQAVNSFGVSEIKAEIQEEFELPTDLTAGSSFTKSVTVANTGTGSAYLRAMVVFSNSEAEGLTSISFNSDDWHGPDQDGYWYYDQPLSPSESTTPLFEQVNVTGSPADGSWDDFDIFVYAEAAQSTNASTGENFATAEEAFASIVREG